jgi:DNA-binding MarR family transcriptional regulator
MSRIIYQSKRTGQDYLIDQNAQQLLAYLYLFGSSHPKEMANRLNYENEDAVVESVDDVLCENKAGLAVIRDTEQLTLGDNRVSEVSLTKDGKKFVDNYKSEIPAPFSVHDYIQEMERIENRIEECLRGVTERLEFFDEDEYSQKELDEMMTMLEEYFDQIRSNRF